MQEFVEILVSLILVSANQLSEYTNFVCPLNINIILMNLLYPLSFFPTIL